MNFLGNVEQNKRVQFRGFVGRRSPGLKLEKFGGGKS
jgi:hypothetical protein